MATLSTKDIDMDIEQALKETGFSRCSFKADGHDKCDECNEYIKKGDDVFYNRTCCEVDDGKYYCESCTIKWAKDIHFKHSQEPSND